MLRAIKRRLYFVVAWYFRVFAAAKLRRWAPKVIVVTGSAGKTTLLHLIEAQLGGRAHYSHHANSAFGISFDILGLDQIRRSRLDWLPLLLKAPIALLSRPYDQKLYVAEVDADRPGEGRFLASLLKPHLTLWVSTLHTHASQFDTSVAAGKFQRVEEAIATEYGHVAAATRELVIAPADSELIKRFVAGINAEVRLVSMNELTDYQPAASETAYVFDGRRYTVPALLPKATYYQVAFVDLLCRHLQIEPDTANRNFVLPPGRSNVFAGIKDTTLIDSTYNNSNIDSLGGVIEMFESYQAAHKWAVIGDMLEQGAEEGAEHQKLAEIINQTHFERLILVGPRTNQHTLPLLSDDLRQRTKVEAFAQPKDVLGYLQQEISGGETILFKGVRFLEAVIETLLADKADAVKLPRREPIWQRRRKDWGF